MDLLQLFDLILQLLDHPVAGTCSHVMCHLTVTCQLKGLLNHVKQVEAPVRQTLLARSCVWGAVRSDSGICTYLFFMSSF